MSGVPVQASTSSNNSATSSENSETQSAEDHQTILPTSNRSAALIRAKSSWKRMKELAAEKEKENEAKRPPWRAVSVSTLAKPDKNALLRAKLLDASRRLRAGKANVAVQTDFVPTKLLKDASISAQVDLILFKDAGILTDGQYSLKKDGYEQYILTYSISQMTDSIETANVSTQTLLPRAYIDEITNSTIFDLKHYFNDELYNMGKNMKNQIKKIRMLDNSAENVLSEPTKGLHGLKLCPTLASWHFDDDITDMEVKEHFIPYTIEALKPWRSFMPVPFSVSGKRLVGRQRIDWYALLQSIDDLVRESNNLLDKVELIIKDRNAHRKNMLETLDEIKNFEPTTFKFPSEHWLPIIEAQEAKLKLLLDSN